MRKSFFSSLLLMIALTTAESFGANWYVAKGASGSNNGTSWTNAWNELNQINFSSVSCGDTIWLAGGNYSSSLNIQKTCTANSVLNINRVLSSDSAASAATGWNSAFDSQVKVTNGTVNLNGGAYYTLNGRVGDASKGIPYGISFNYTGSSTTAISKSSSSAIDHVTLSYLEVYGPSCVTSGSCSGNTWGIQIASSAKDTYTLIDHVWVHRFAEVIRPWNTYNLTIQYSSIGEDNTTPSDHSDLIYAGAPVQNVTLRFNRWYSSANDGIWWDTPGNAVGLSMYGNIVYHSGGWLMGFPRCSTPCGPVHVYNNIFENDGTFGDYQPGWIGADSGSTLAAGSEFANNIYYRVNPDGGSGSLGSVFDYNAFDSTAQTLSCSGCFTFSPGSALSSFNGWVDMMGSGNIVKADFHLTDTGKTLFQGKGKNLGAPYNVDIDGNIRPSTGPWTLGPYEVGSGTSTGPAPPSNLTALVQ
jgi:hypothetical protein